MNKSLIAGIGIGVAAALGIAAVAGGAAAGGNWFKPRPEYAQVSDVKPLVETIKTPHRQCRTVNVQHRRAVQDENRIAGSVLGAVAGGVIGHQFGGGRGRDVATVAGALAGGYAGNQTQQALQNRDTYTSQHQRCSTVYTRESKTKGYRVTYTIDGKKGVVDMDHKPGDRIPLDSKGQLKLNQAAS